MTGRLKTTKVQKVQSSTVIFSITYMRFNSTAVCQDHKDGVGTLEFPGLSSV